MRAPRWRPIIRWALLGAVIGIAICLFDYSATHDTQGSFVAAVPGTPLAEQQRGDGIEVAGASGHDGSQFYAIARGPLDFDSLQTHLDKPRYRMQRILFPAVSWLLHPTGPGMGLVWTMFAVLAIGAVLGGLATGVLGYGLGGPPWVAALFGPMLGSILSLRISTPDALALGLAITAIALSLYGRNALAVVVAVAAVLTREPVLFLLFGFAVWRRDRQGITLLAVPGLVAAGWYLFLAYKLPGTMGTSEPSAEAFVAPFTGWRDAISFWLSNVEGPLGFLSAASGLILAGFALVRTRPSHPLWWPIAVSCFLLIFYAVSVLAPERNASRIFLPIQILSIIALTTRSADRRVLAKKAPKPAAAGS